LYEDLYGESIVEDALRVVKEGVVFQNFTKRARKAVSLSWDPARKTEEQLQQFVKDTPVKKSNPDFPKMFLTYLASTQPTAPSDV